MVISGATIHRVRLFTLGNGRGVKQQSLGMSCLGPMCLCVFRCREDRCFCLQFYFGSLLYDMYVRYVVWYCMVWLYDFVCTVAVCIHLFIDLFICIHCAVYAAMRLQEANGSTFALIRFVGIIADESHSLSCIECIHDEILGSNSTVQTEEWGSQWPLGRQSEGEFIIIYMECPGDWRCQIINCLVHNAYEYVHWLDILLDMVRLEFRHLSFELFKPCHLDHASIVFAVEMLTLWLQLMVSIPAGIG